MSGESCVCIAQTKRSRERCKKPSDYTGFCIYHRKDRADSYDLTHLILVSKASNLAPGLKSWLVQLVKTKKAEMRDNRLPHQQRHMVQRPTRGAPRSDAGGLPGTPSNGIMRFNPLAFIELAQDELVHLSDNLSSHVLKEIAKLQATFAEYSSGSSIANYDENANSDEVPIGMHMKSICALLSKVTKKDSQRIRSGMQIKEYAELKSADAIFEVPVSSFQLAI